MISRHGEYRERETECNIPSELTGGNGLVITTFAISYTVAIGTIVGTVRTSPSSYPYTTGDVQWNAFSFLYAHSNIVPLSRFQYKLWPRTGSG